MKTFGSDKIIELIKSLVAKEDESFQHSMISSFIKNAQQKLKQKLSYEHPSRWQAGWMRQNILQ